MQIIPHINRCAAFLFIAAFFLHIGSVAATGSGKGPVARYSFNNGSAIDEVGGSLAKTYNLDLWEDRFGNPGHALYFRGNRNSYANLGTGNALKPETGSLSLWVNVFCVLSQGTGVTYNPFLSTKSSNSPDCCEAYAVYLETTKPYRFGACHQDSCTRATSVSGNNGITFGEWYHVVITFDNDRMCLYENGELRHSESTGFETRFLGGDSVILGYYNNIKNIRFFRGAIDDVEFYDRVLDPAEIKALYHAPDPNRRKVIFRQVLLVLGILLLLLLAFYLLRHYIRVSIKKGKERLELANKLLENELRINRALMNPHFIFNSMNTLHNYIIHRDSENAADYLVKFSRLIRKILESNMSDTITLEMEVDLLKGYIEIECVRFREHITSRIVIEPPLQAAATVIPIMMVQPFVENAVWHGLSRKNGGKELTVTFSLYRSRYVKCVIEDNGVGRKNRQTAAAEKSSLATNFIIQRIGLLNKIHHTAAYLSITDKPDQSGTIIELVLPILNN